tara:strand:- start:6206 stop:6940 length:735 start_codon:yes stop_codon:yes gene_type:complete
MSVLSNLPLCDEMICVDNGSTDGTVDVLERLEKAHDKIKFINRPDIVHLYENRQVAFEHSRYSWVVRGDSDFIAWNSGHRDIRNLRKTVLDTDFAVPPIGFELVAQYVLGDWTKTKQQTVSVGRRIYQRVEGMAFDRLGRWEGVRVDGMDPHTDWERVKLNTPYWMHASIQDAKTMFLRLYRTGWREQGDFDVFPTCESWARHKRPEMFEGDEIQRWRDRLVSALKPYTGEYPDHVQAILKPTI